MLNKNLRFWKVLIDSLQQLSAADMNSGVRIDGRICTRAAQPHADGVDTLKGKEEKMIKCKVILAVVMVLLIGLVSAVSVNAAEVQKININTATAEELAQLKGIGPSHAAKIVAYREKNGPFKMPEDLMQVSGIGQKTFEANQEIIVVEEPKPKKK